jgi:hypothetical protein
MLDLQSGDEIEHFYEHAPATAIRATVSRLLTDRDEGMGIEVEDYIACRMETSQWSRATWTPNRSCSLALISNAA